MLTLRRPTGAEALALLLTLPSLLAMAGCSGPTRNVTASNKHYDLAADLIHHGDYDSAQSEAKRALVLDPQNADADELIGEIYLLRGNRSTQFITIEQCAQGQEAADYVASRNQSLKDAESWFDRARAIHPSDPRTLDNYGVAALNLEDWDKVIQVDGDAIAVENFPSRFLAEGDLGWAYFKKGDLLHATEELKQALAIAPHYCVGSYRLAEVYLAQGNLDAAEAAAKPVDEKLDECPIQENERLLGLVRVKRGDLAGGATYFKKCMSFSPKSCVADDCGRYLSQVNR